MGKKNMPASKPKAAIQYVIRYISNSSYIKDSWCTFNGQTMGDVVWLHEALAYLKKQHPLAVYEEYVVTRSE